MVVAAVCTHRLDPLLADLLASTYYFIEWRFFTPVSAVLLNQNDMLPDDADLEEVCVSHPEGGACLYVCVGGGAAGGWRWGGVGGKWASQQRPVGVSAVLLIQNDMLCMLGLTWTMCIQGTVPRRGGQHVGTEQVQAAGAEQHDGRC